MKTCSKCKIEKSIELFSKDKYRKDGLKPECKSCIKTYRELNKEYIEIYRKNYYKINKEYIKKISKKYKEENKDKIKKYNKNYKELNREKIKQYEYNRLNTNKFYKFSHNVRNLISNSFKRGNNKFIKNSKTEIILGCTIEEFRLYIENKFIDDMTLENYGKWHLDHIKPLALATNEEEIIKLNHYTNFQPLWAEDNLIKGSKY